MKKLISIGLIVAILVTILVPALISGMPSDPIWPPPAPARLLYFDMDYCDGFSIDGRIKAIEGTDRELQLRITADCSDDYYSVNDLEFIVALWSEDNPVLYKVYRHGEEINEESGPLAYYTISVKEDSIVDSWDYGLVYVQAEGEHIPFGWHSGMYGMWQVRFINDEQPVIESVWPYTIDGLWSLYVYMEQMWG